MPPCWTGPSRHCIRGWAGRKPGSDQKMPGMSFKRARAAALVLAASLALTGCESIDNLFNSNKGDEVDANYVERPVAQIYKDAWTAVDQGNWSDAAKQFA